MKAAFLALAVVAVTARLLRKRHAAPPPQPDDSEVVGMPTSWPYVDGLPVPKRRVQSLPTF